MTRYLIACSAGVAALLAACAAPEQRSTMLPAPPMEAIGGPGATAVPVPVVKAPPSLLARLQRLAPDVDPGVLALALQARSCALQAGDVGDDSRLAVIDYSRPSTQRRLWVFDVARDRLLHHEHVAHGQGSGDNHATRFSNQHRSHATSLGLFRTAETYMGGNGYSLRMDGLEAGFNDNARARAIVVHGAAYAEPHSIPARGRLGRSHGCPAVRQSIARILIDDIKQRQLVFAYANDAQWLRQARSFACDGRTARQILEEARAVAAHGGDSHEGVVASP